MFVIAGVVSAGVLAVPCLLPWAGRAAIGHAGVAQRTTTVVQPAKPAMPLPTSQAVFPLKIGPTGRYLVDSKGHPFMIVGDSPQSLIVNLSVSQANDYFADRAAAGFNAVWINLLCDTYTGGRPDGTTYDGIAPFTTPGDLSTPNPAYFARADEMIRLAAKRGIAVFLDPIETGGWLDVLRQNGSAAAYAYGLYLGSRYRKFSNIVWLNGNDFETWTDPSDDALVLAVAKGIKASDPKALQTVELNETVSMSLDDPSWRGIVGLDAVYTYAPTYAEMSSAYVRSDRAPTFLVEANYEGENGYVGPSTLRRQEYWTMLSGGTGQIYGDKYTWPFLKGWSSRLDTIGSQQITFLKNLFSPRPWFNLVPDTNQTLAVSGYGTYSGAADLNTNNYVTAARTPNGRLAMAYLPSGGAIKINMARMAGPRVQAQWYDPTDGKYRTVSGSSFSDQGVRRFASPGKNHEGDRDWVLVLTATKTSIGNS